MTDYSITRRDEALDYMAEYPGFGEMRSYTKALDAEQTALTWRRMPPGTGGRGSYGHRHDNQEELYLVTAGVVTFKVGDDVFEAQEGTAVRVATDAFRSIHNDTDEPADLIICSPRADDPSGEKLDDFWPE
ncbi:MAG TPA: cupin domain-containing protein [Solirubrobacterales bacterium]|nr:cupin domain-containing protein [Solirubrobacterales bacterium]